MSEITKDLGGLSTQWNQSLTPMTSSLPDGTVDVTVDAFKFGLSGSHMYVDAQATARLPKYFNVVKDRPNTIKEQMDGIYAELANISLNVSSVEANTSGLTDEQKARIGINIFDNLQTSSPTSLDGLTSRNNLNIQQLGHDLYGDDYALNNDGNPILTNPLKEMVGALLAIHNGSWSGDVNVDHQSIDNTAIRTFIGQDDATDSTPTYSSTNVVTQSASLETAIGELDAAMGAIGVNLDTIYEGGSTSAHQTMTILDADGGAIIVAGRIDTGNTQAAALKVEFGTNTGSKELTKRYANNETVFGTYNPQHEHLEIKTNNLTDMFYGYQTTAGDEADLATPSKGFGIGEASFITYSGSALPIGHEGFVVLDGSTSTTTSLHTLGTMHDGYTQPPIWYDGADNVLTIRGQTTSNVPVTIAEIPLMGGEIGFDIELKIVGKAPGAHAYNAVYSFLCEGSTFSEASLLQQRQHSIGSGAHWDVTMDYISPGKLQVIASGMPATTVEWRGIVSILGAVSGVVT
jgi:hypothetical protein